MRIAILKISAATAANEQGVAGEYAVAQTRLMLPGVWPGVASTSMR